MKRSLFLASALLCGMAAFTSCSDDETASALEIDMSKLTTVKGYAFADLNLTTAGLEAAEGQKVAAYILGEDITTSVVSTSNNYSYYDDELGAYNTGAKGTSNVPAKAIVWADTVTVAADGSYSINFPVGIEASTLTIAPLAFEFEQVQPFNSEVATIKKVFTCNSFKVNAKEAGGIIKQDAKYSIASIVGYTQMVSVSGKFLAELTDVNNNTTKEIAPSGKEITFYTKDESNITWHTKVSTQASGEYKVSVPVGTNVYISYEFKENVTTSGVTEIKTFKQSEQLVDIFGVTAVVNKEIVLLQGK